MKIEYAAQAKVQWRYKRGGEHKTLLVPLHGSIAELTTLQTAYKAAEKAPSWTSQAAEYISLAIQDDGLYWGDIKIVTLEGRKFPVKKEGKK